MGWDFVAIDFETATPKRDSPCSIGMTVVQNGQIVKSEERLIKPAYSSFDPFCVRIHGITESDVRDAPEFDSIWNEIKPYFSDSLVVAHNAGFDISVLRSTLSLYGIAPPPFHFACTEKVSRKKWDKLINYRLDTICRHLDIPLDNHHNAAEDSYACASILLRILHEHDVQDVWALAETLGFCFGYVSESKYLACSAPGTAPKSRTKVHMDQLTFPENPPTDSPISSKLFVFTGSLDYMTRQEAMQFVLNMGGVPRTQVSRRTDYLVVGEFDYARLVNGEASTKLLKARSLAESGLGIQIISEKDFLRMIMGQELDKEEV